jgi:hypothetical protein
MIKQICKQNINIVHRIFASKIMIRKQRATYHSSYKVLIITALFLIQTGLLSEKIQAQSGSKLVELCNSVAGQDATYLKDFYVELDAAGPDGKAPEQRFTIVLSKNTEYRFTVCNAEGSAGKAILQLYDVTKLYASTYNPQTGQTFQSFNFQCQKTGAYHLIISFLDGKKGSAVVIASFIRTL